MNPELHEEERKKQQPSKPSQHKKSNAKPHSDKDQNKKHHLLDVNSLKGHGYSVDGLCFSPNGRSLATACADGVVRVFKLDDASSKSFKFLKISLPVDGPSAAVSFCDACVGGPPVAVFKILHARWAMLAAFGAFVPESLDLLGAFHFVESVWWRVGYLKLKGDTLDYLGIPGLLVAGSQGVIVIAICQVLLMVGPEYARYCGIEALEPLRIYFLGDINYPGGGLFDPLNLSQDPVAFKELKMKELMNGSLAMVAWLGFYVQDEFIES